MATKKREVVDPSPAELQRAAFKRSVYREDFRLFARDEVKIRSMSGGLIPLILTESQELCYRRVERQRATQGYIRGVCLKPRQSGFSTLWEAILFQLAALNPHVSTLLIAADAKSTNAIFRMAHLMYEQLSEGIQPMIRYMNKEELDFRNPDKYQRGADVGLDSRMEFQTAKNAIAGTGTTRQALHLSEVAKWSEELTDDLATSLMPSIQRLPNTYMVYESTAFEGGDYFRELCEEAEDGEKRVYKGDRTGGGCELFFHFAPWWVDSKNSAPLIEGEEYGREPEERALQEYAQVEFPKKYPHLGIGPHTITPEQFKFRVQEIKALKGERNFNQEYPKNPRDAWINRDNWAFDHPSLLLQRKNLQAPAEFVEIDDGPRLLGTGQRGNVFKDRPYVAIWKKPQEGVTYDIGVDSAMGGEDGDWTVAIVLRRDTREQVAEYHKHILPMDAAREIYWLGKIYNTAQLIIEMNLGPGILVNQHLDKTLHYPYLYTWRNFNRQGDVLTLLSGWETNFKSKKIMVGTTADKIVHKDIIIRSKVLYDEMAAFVRLGQDEYRGSRGAFDDAVMALMMAVMGGEHEGHVDPGESVLPKEDDGPISPALRDNRKSADERRMGRLASAELRELSGMR